MRLVLAAGCFDLFHVAHLRYLQNAARLGDQLVVSVTKDNGVGKGEGRPIIPEKERLEVVQAVLKGFDCPSKAALFEDGFDALKKWQPDIFAKGHDWKVRGIPKHIKDYCRANGIRIVFTKPNPKPTTGGIIERIK